MSAGWLNNEYDLSSYHEERLIAYFPFKGRLMMLESNHLAVKIKTRVWATI